MVKKFTKEIYLLVTIGIILQSFSYLSIKFSTLASDKFFITLYLFFAFLLFFIRAVLWQKLLNYVKLSEIYPYTSLVQILILIYSVVFFHETVTFYNVLGLTIMLSGIFYMSKTHT